jgi:hypothetical protein
VNAEPVVAALAANKEGRLPMERIGILLWEMDWRAERESILAERAGGELTQISTA